MSGRVLTVTDPLCHVDIVIFKDGSAQAVVSSNNLKAVVVPIAPPPEGERIAVKRMPDGCVDVWYEAMGVSITHQTTEAR